MLIACVDMEGVLIPEIWPYIAEKTGVSELAITTREVPNYNLLVHRRMTLLKENNLTLKDLQIIVNELNPYEDAKTFLEKLEEVYEILLVSDAFFDLIQPLWKKLGSPKIECHRFVINDQGFIEDAIYVRKDKAEVIKRYKLKNIETLAIGDAFNDIGMLNAANKGFLFRPSEETANKASYLNIVYSYEDILLGL
ncbi:bifunctional phosphoserine phosphatase/homoserine phosphotransferase ThrH [Colwellia sp. UCD-KL20]|uniref:bifunctional phosphoserine phosphatase/homoserine phosphotransferase ThrH n=1 Tax=Colwellia sp. UCD-KL20 TaxID=1917165 RepID=UPI0009710EE9|nr:bifunctional phosphoserine phosphatase/homoserine phosphotransferase ThrH [Colwellia sp. UCD-KL20]